MATEKCLDVIFDWDRVGVGRYDARITRSCRSNAARSSGTQNEPYNVGAINKLATCYGIRDSTNSPVSQCSIVIEAEGTIASVNTDLPNACVRSWILTAGGTSAYYAAGDSASCTS